MLPTALLTRLSRLVLLLLLLLLLLTGLLLSAALLLAWLLSALLLLTGTLIGVLVLVHSLSFQVTEGPLPKGRAANTTRCGKPWFPHAPSEFRPELAKS